MMARVGMAVNKLAATPTAQHVIAENSMTCVMSVVQSVIILSRPLGRALKKSPFFMTKTENAYDL